MSVWTDIGDFLSSIASDAFSNVVESIRTVFEGDAETRRRVAFSVAIIALSAKMAKADGIVTDDEVEAFQQIFSIPPDELNNVARVYNLAKQDVAGFESYASQVRKLFPGDQPEDDDVLRDVIEALFHIAKADGLMHENEFSFLEEIAVRFGFSAQDFENMQFRHVEGEGCDPYCVLEADPSWPFDKLKSHYRKKAAENHPDRLIARGVPEEFIVIANERLAAINAAWEKVQNLHRGKISEGALAT